MRLLPVLLLIPLALPTTEAAGLVPDPTACWLLDELSGTVAKDACGANDGTYTNGPLLQAEGVFGFAADFDGSNDHVAVPHNAAIQPTASFTLGVWVNPDTVTTTTQLMRKLTIGPTSGYLLWIDGSSSDKFLCQVFDNNLVTTAISTTLAVAGQWHSVHCTFDSVRVRIYINGVLEHANTGTASGVGGTTAPLYLGAADGASEFLNGRLDRAFVSRTVYTDRQIADIDEASEFEQASQEMVWVHHANPSNGAIATTTVKVPRERDKEPIVSSFSTWEVSGTFSAPMVAGGGTQTFQFQADGANIAGCTWTVIRGAVALGIVVTQESNFLLRCPHPFYLEPGSHTVAVTTAGSSLVTASHIDVMLLQETSHLDYGSLYGPVNYEWVDERTMFQSNQTNSYVNASHVHIDSHFNQTYTFLNQSFDAQDTLIVFRTSQTNGYVNDSRIAILSAINDLDVSIDCGANGTSCEFEPMTMIDLPGMTDQQVGAFLLFLTLLLISFFQRWLFVAIASVIGILDVVLIGGIFGFAFTGLLVVLGIVIQILVDHRDAMKAEKVEREESEVGT